MINTIAKTDAELKANVLFQLEYESSVKVMGISVLVRDGTVTLKGYVINYSEKQKAVCTVKRIFGVKAIADNIEIKLLTSLHYTDADIAAAAAQHIKWCSLIPTESIKSTRVKAGSHLIAKWRSGIRRTLLETPCSTCLVSKGCLTWWVYRLNYASQTLN